LDHWNKEVFGNVEERKKALLEEIQVLDGLEDERELVEEERVRGKQRKLFGKSGPYARNQLEVEVKGDQISPC
jgi:hypothetical protein